MMAMRCVGTAVSAASLRARQPVAAPVLRKYQSTTPSTPPSQCNHNWSHRTRRWARRFRVRATLTCHEWRDSAAEWRSSDLKLDRVLPAVKTCLERAHSRCRQASASFDERFNRSWAQGVDASRDRWAKLKDGLQADGGNAEKTPLDLPATLIMGAGVGGAWEGYYVIGAVVFSCGVSRAVCRFVTQRVDADDVEGLFRWVPSRWCQHKKDIFARLKAEVIMGRRLYNNPLLCNPKRYDDEAARRALDPNFDYTPEQVFDVAMKAITVHPRVREAIGGEVRDVVEPDKVIYRKFEGLTEIALGWEVVGEAGGAEIQVSSSGSILDFIYVFPKATDRYGLTPESFVIRPEGSWSQNSSEKHRYMKQPFGKKGDRERLFHHREGIYEWDYSVGEFRHGAEFGRPGRTRR
eukprot:TRINITY_DN54706_c0_g1_i1.p1 TRINITY_DN54706_c0_g1~~TRINITY_DN54706_c0_g1_i1.p1  ORF type:complete len:432 (+),score=57.90 TRINITY_DN54706_c0_g1_i1:76-1296(+)